MGDKFFFCLGLFAAWLTGGARWYDALVVYGLLTLLEKGLPQRLKQTLRLHGCARTLQNKTNDGGRNGG